jgi:hypothetical protein
MNAAEPMNRNTVRTLALALGLAFAAACATSGFSGTLPAGQGIGLPLEARPILHFAVVDATPEKFLEQTLLVEATVEVVCQKKGCWMQIEDDGHRALVRWESGCGGKYAFPRDATGKRVLVQGSFYKKKISPEDAEHLQQESGGKLALASETYEFNASGVRILD